MKDIVKNNKRWDVLITGGTGFVGSAIIEYLIGKDYTVVCIDTNVDTFRINKNMEKLTLVKGDVMDEKLIDQWVSRCARVMHLAAIVGVDYYVQNPLKVLDVNIIGTRNVLTSCLKYNRPVLLTSTSEVYGKNDELLNEDSNRLYGSSANSRWCYAVSKSACEHYAHALGKQGLTYTIVRYFNVYGPTMDATEKGRVVGKFLAAIRDKKPMTLVDGGKAIRSFCYIDDAVVATSRMILELSDDSSFNGEAINIGRTDPVTIEHLANLMTALSGQQAGIEYKPGASFFGQGFEEIPDRVPEVSKLEKLLNFKAEITLEEGIAKTLDYWGYLNGSIKESRKIENKERIPAVRPILDPSPKMLNDFETSLRSGWVSNNGPHVRRFEHELAKYLGVEDVVAVSNCADALSLSFRLLKVKGKVILPSYTFIATLNAVIENNLTPVFCDIDPQTFTLSCSEVERLLDNDPEIACIVPVNVFGVPAELEQLSLLAKKAKVQMLYDNAHGFGTIKDGKKVSEIPDIQVFSFHGTKTLPSVEGGLLISNRKELIDEAKIIRNHGIAPDLLKSKVGMNTKMDELRAIVGLHSLERFEKSNRLRRGYATRLRNYVMEKCDSLFSLQYIPDGVISNFQNLAIRCKNPDINLTDIIKAFDEQGIEAKSYFNPALHKLEHIKEKFNLPVTELVWSSLVCIPVHNFMTEPDLCAIEEALSTVTESLEVKKNVDYIV